jgi:ketosteroid isomerase-like protein
MGAPSLSPEDVQALKDITATHVRTSLAADWKGWTSTCSDDVILLPPGDHRIDGKMAAAEWLEGFPRVLEFAGEPSLVRGSENMAFTTGIARAKLEMEGEVVDAAMKWLAIFERQDDGGWKMLVDMWNGNPMDDE